MRVIQLMNSDNEYAGLYATQAADNGQDQEIFNQAFKNALKQAEEEDIFFMDAVDEYLEKKGYSRVLADVVTTDSI
jgi:hypothetical protein